MCTSNAQLMQYLHNMYWRLTGNYVHATKIKQEVVIIEHIKN